MKLFHIAKEIRAALGRGHVYYVNWQAQRVFGIKIKAPGQLMMKVIKHAPAQLHHGSITWIPFTGGKIVIDTATSNERAFNTKGEIK